MKNQHVIGTGYHHGAKWMGGLNPYSFASLWHNHIRIEHGWQDHIYTIDHNSHTLNDKGGKMIPYISDAPSGAMSDIIRCADLGHVHQYIGEEKPERSGQLCGFSAHILALAMIAYNANRDLVYLEQDCLIFGSIISKIYEEMDANKWEMSFGRNHIGGIGISQSLFIIRHGFILRFIQYYLSLWPDTTKNKRPEHKFRSLLAHYPSYVGTFSFGLDRDRPINWECPVFYAQHFTEAEFEQGILAKRIHV